MYDCELHHEGEKLAFSMEFILAALTPWRRWNLREAVIFILVAPRNVIEVWRLQQW